MRRISLCLPTLAFLMAASTAQPQTEAAPKDRTFVTVEPISTVVVRPGHSTPVAFTFHVAPGYHVNSHTPAAPELIPTEVHFSLPGSDVVIGRIRYPAGELKSFPFDPTAKLSVYSGTVIVRALVVSPPNGSADTYTVHGELKYQACDNNACYPPKKLPFQFNVKVGTRARGTRKARPNAQSPHIH